MAEGEVFGLEFVYRISTAEEWEELQRKGATSGGELDKSTGCIHLSKLDQVLSTLQNFFKNSEKELYLLQIDSTKVKGNSINRLIEEILNSDASST